MIRCNLCGEIGHPFSRCPRAFRGFTSGGSGAGRAQEGGDQEAGAGQEKASDNGGQSNGGVGDAGGRVVEASGVVPQDGRKKSTSQVRRMEKRRLDRVKVPGSQEGEDEGKGVAPVPAQSEAARSNVRAGPLVGERAPEGAGGSAAPMPPPGVRSGPPSSRAEGSVACTGPGARPRGRVSGSGRAGGGPGFPPNTPGPGTSGVGKGPRSGGVGRGARKRSGPGKPVLPERPSSADSEEEPGWSKVGTSKRKKWSLVAGRVGAKVGPGRWVALECQHHHLKY